MLVWFFERKICGSPVSDQVHFPGFFDGLNPLVDQQLAVNAFDVELDRVEA